MVLNAESANKLIVVARTSGGQTEEKGITLFIVDSSADGVVRENFPTVDGLRASEVSFENVRVSKEDMVSKKDEGFEILQAIANDAILALAAEAEALAFVMDLVFHLVLTMMLVCVDNRSRCYVSKTSF